MKYRWMLFDADGTVFDYDRCEAVALQKAFEHFGLRFQPDYVQSYRRINKQIWREFERGEIAQVELRTKRRMESFLLPRRISSMTGTRPR